MQRLKGFGWVLACVLLATAPALAQEKSHEGADKGKGGDEMAAMMAAMMKYSTPGKHHAYLKPLAGKWRLASKFRMAPEAPWDTSGGEATIEWILGGRFLKQSVKSPATEEMPMDFEGFGLFGYDKLAEKFLGIWMDSYFTGAMVFHGTCDASGKVITLSGEFKNPMKGGALTKERWVYRIINQDKFIFEMWEHDENGKDYLHGEITYTRVR